MATAIVGRMQATLGLDTTGFSRRLSAARGETRSLGRDMKAAATQIAAGLSGAMASVGAITTATVSLATETARLAQVAGTTPEVLQRWAAAAKSVGLEQGDVADVIKDMNDAVGDFMTTGAGPMEDFFEQIGPKIGVTIEDFRRLSGPEALQLYVDSLEKAGVNQQQMTFLMGNLNESAAAMVPLLRNGGVELARLGDKAQDLGAVLDNETVAAMRGARTALADISTSMLGLRNRIAVAALPSLRLMADTLAQASGVGGALTRVVTALAGNLDRIVAYAGVATVGIGTYLTGAFVAARLAGGALAVTLGGLKAALIRTGFGVAIVAAGELALQFTRLVRATGGIGGALTALRSVGDEVFGRMGLALRALVARADAAWEGIKAGGLRAYAAMIKAAVSFANRYIGVYRGVFGALKALWSGLPSILGSAIYTAINTTLSAVKAFLNTAISYINSFIDTINDKIPERLKSRFEIGVIGQIDGEGLKNPYDGATGQTAGKMRDAFSRGYQTNTATLPAMSGTLAAADAAEEAVGSARLNAQVLASLAKGPLDSWKALTGAITEGEAAAEGATVQVGQLGDKLSSAGTLGAEAVEKTTDKITALTQATNDWQSSWREGFKGLVTGTKSLGEALSGVLSKLSDMMLDQAFNTLWSGAAGGGGGLGGLAGGILSAFGIGANANGTDFWRGGLTAVNERGGEILNLPRGTQVIPHDLSKRMVDRASQGTQALSVSVGFDDSIGGMQAWVRDAAGRVVAQAAPGIIREATSATAQAMSRTKAFGGAL